MWAKERRNPAELNGAGAGHDARPPRFGGAILLSVLGGGINALGASIGGGSTIVVNSTNEANSLISQAARGTDIPPTIKTNQGALVKIFVARDLDFTSVGPARR